MGFGPNIISYHEVGEILSWHEALFSSIRKSEVLRSQAQLSLVDSRLLEAKAIRRSLEITRSHGISQASLKSAINLSKIAEPAYELDIDGAANFDLANVLWDQGEMTASIRMLQQLKDQPDLHKQAIPLSRPELLVTLVRSPPSPLFSGSYETERARKKGPGRVTLDLYNRC